MAGATIAVANAELNAHLRATAFTGPASLFASIHTGDPGDNGANEYTAYTGTRPSITFGPPVGKATVSTGQLDYNNMGNTTATPISYMGFWSAASGGTFIDSIPLIVSRITQAGDTLRFSPGAVTRTITG
jgi:hypothetical protein